MALWRSLLNTPAPRAGQYASMHRASLERPDAYWRAAADLVHWHSKGSRALRPAAAGQKAWEYQWFPSDDALGDPPAPVRDLSAPLPEPAPGRWTLNACENMLDVHVRAGHGARPALVYDSAVTGVKEVITFAQMQERVSVLAGALRHAGVKPGDRVLFYMPMIPQAVEGMLACARLGAVHAVQFGGFAAAELAKRIASSKPKIIFTASCGIEGLTKVLPYKPALDEAIALSGHTPEKVLVWQRAHLRAELNSKGGQRDEDWREYVAKHGRHTEPVPVPANHPLYMSVEKLRTRRARCFLAYCCLSLPFRLTHAAVCDLP
jgi:propionyl-CoA synthetase